MDTEWIKRELYSGLICDVLDQMGYRNQALGREFMPLDEDTVLFGKAFTSIGTTVYSMPADPLTAQCKVIDQLGEGEVYIFCMRGDYNCAVLGELMATAIEKKKGAGALIDGYVRDIRAVREMKFPLFYKGTHPQTSKGRCEINECQIPVLIDGVTINPGDYIFGDVDGVAVIPGALIDEVIERAQETERKETAVRDRLQAGQDLSSTYAKLGAI